MLMSIAFGVAMGEAEPDSAAGPSPAQTNRNPIMVRIRPFIYVVLVLLVALGGYFFVKRLIYARHMIQAEKAMESRDYLEAIKFYQKELEVTPDDFDLHMKLGKIYMKIGEKKKARDIYSRALLLQPDNFEILKKTGVLNIEFNDMKPAELVLKRAVTVNPRDASAHFFLARVYHEQLKGPEAEKEYLKALECGYDKSRVYYNLGFLYEYNLENYEKALFSYQNYLTAGGDKKEIAEKKVRNLKLWVEGQKLEDRGEYKKAISEYEKALAKEPTSIELLTRIGRAYRKNNDFAKAEEIYLKALYLHKDDYYILNNLGNVYFTIERYDDAEGCWINAIKVKPKHPSAHYNMAALYERKGKFQEASKEYEKAYEYGYDEPTVLMHLAVIYEGALKNPGKALEWYRKYAEAGGPEKDKVQKKIDSMNAQAVSSSSPKPSASVPVSSPSGPSSSPLSGTVSPSPAASSSEGSPTAVPASSSAPQTVAPPATLHSPSGVSAPVPSAMPTSVQKTVPGRLTTPAVSSPAQQSSGARPTNQAAPPPSSPQKRITAPSQPVSKPVKTEAPAGGFFDTPTPLPAKGTDKDLFTPPSTVDPLKVE
ncbi:MAG: tetratricopeptide repeat protein [Vulcanimicrobiota bacterium]